MKKTLHVFLIIIASLLITFCSGFSVKTDIKSGSALSKIKNAGLIFRVSRSSKISKDELNKGSFFYLPLYHSAEKITVISHSNNDIHYYNTNQDRFYQLSDNDSYLKFKSIGAVNYYIRKNENDLKSIISSENLDGLVIYETYSVISTEMLFMDLESVVTILDKNLNILYLDHQSDSFESEFMAVELMKDRLLNIINERLVKVLQDLDILGDRLDEDEISKKEMKINYKEEGNPPVVEKKEDIKPEEAEPKEANENKNAEKKPAKAKINPVKKSGTESEEIIELKSEPKTEVKSEVHPEIKPEDSAQYKPEIQPEMRQEAEPEVKAESEPEVKPEVQSDVQPENNPEESVPAQ